MIYNLLFFCFVDLLTSELVLIDPFMTGPITYAGLMTASSILSSSEIMRERKHHKVTDRKKREKENKHYILRRGKNAESGVYDSYYVTSLDKRSRAIVEMTS